MKCHMNDKFLTTKKRRIDKVSSPYFIIIAFLVKNECVCAESDKLREMSKMLISFFFSEEDEIYRSLFWLLDSETSIIEYIQQFLVYFGSFFFFAIIQISLKRNKLSKAWSERIFFSSPLFAHWCCTKYTKDPFSCCVFCVSAWINLYPFSLSLCLSFFFSHCDNLVRSTNFPFLISIYRSEVIKIHSLASVTTNLTPIMSKWSL